MKSHFLQKGKLYAAVLLCLGFIAFGQNTMNAQGSAPSVVTSPQQIRATGVVSDAEGPLIGASIRQKGNPTNGTSTDIDGKFSISVPKGAVLLISYVGMKGQEVKVTGQPLDIILESSSDMLDEVVVVGFGTQKKVNLTGSVSVADQKALKERPVTNAAQALQGVVPGLQITTGSGKLGATPSIQIRGNGTIGDGSSGNPLVLIDGMEGDINMLNPQDIESISVLKDAAAASIYGSRAPFGVILITTKKGSEGKPTINYNNSFRFSNLINRPHTQDSYTFALSMNDYMTNSNRGAYFNTDDIDKILAYQQGTLLNENGVFDPLNAMAANGEYWKNPYDHDGAWANTDWFDELYKNTSFSQEHNLSVSGGKEKFNYYFSANLLDNGGMMKLGKEDYKRYSITGKFNVDLYKWLSFGFSHRWVRNDYSRPSFMTWYNSGNGDINEEDDVLYDVTGRQGWPIIPMYDPNGYIYDAPSPANNLINGGKARTQTDRNYTQLNLIFRPLKGWDIHAEFNYSTYSHRFHSDYQTLYNHKVDGSIYSTDGGNSGRIIERNQHENFYNVNVYSNYDFTLAEKNNFHFMLGFQTEGMQQSKYLMERRGILNPDLPEIDLTTGLDGNGNPVNPMLRGGRYEWSTAGFFGRINYNFDNRYLAEFNLRYDGTSRFRENRRWIWLPSVSLGWNIANEKFWEELTPVCNNLKLRASYGMLGNQNINNWYQTYRSMSINMGNGGWLQNGSKPNTAGFPALISQLLTWEKIYNYNVGLDWGFFNNRLTGSFEWFIRDTKNMVGPAAELPNILGADVPKTNNCDLRTHGWELEIAWNDRLPFGLTYGARFVLSDARTKVTKYEGNLTNSLDKFIPGRYIDEIWGYETVGIARSNDEMNNYLDGLDANYTNFHGSAPAAPREGMKAIGSDLAAGDIMYKDLNGDGVIDWGANTIDDHGDKKLLGSKQPRYMFSLDLTAAYKGFDLRVFFQGVGKRDFFQNHNYFWGADNSEWWAQFLTQHADYFRDENSWSVANGYADTNLDSYYPRPVKDGGSKNRQVQSRYLQDASYIRLKNLQVGYTLPAHLTRKAGFENVRVYFSGENLWTGTHMSNLFDPETIGSAKGGSTMPMSRTYSFGISVTL